MMGEQVCGFIEKEKLIFLEKVVIVTQLCEST